MSSEAILDTAAEIAFEVFDEARTSLAVSVRFLDVALWRMPLERATLGAACATDGYRFAYDPVRAIAQYRQSSAETVRDYLHAILHCVFRHPFEPARANAQLWDLACDIAVESTAMELAGLRYPSARDRDRTRALTRLQESCPTFTAAKVYRALAGDWVDGQAVEPTVSTSLVESMLSLFERDDHSIWTHSPETKEGHAKVDKSSKVAPFESSSKLKGKGPEASEEEDNPRDDVSFVDGAPSESHGGTAMEADVENGDRFVTAQMSHVGASEIQSMEDVAYTSDFADVDWADISAMIDAELGAYEGKFGADRGAFAVNLSVANRKSCDFREFMRRFAALSEEMKVSTEEFDYVYYTYGLRLYDNMPLVEPLEYEETKRVREFVIAIDTSASCAGAFVRRFVERTYDILRSTATFGRKVNVHIVQCDSDIRKVTKITELRDVDGAFAEFQSRGYGGTDFRPVFKYVNDQIAAREFKNLKGLVYLTDGLGKFPEEEPGYQTVFVFVDETAAARDVPPWALKAYISEDEIVEL